MDRAYQSKEINPAFAGDLGFLLLREKSGRIILEPRSMEPLRSTIDSYVANQDFDVLRGYAGVNGELIGLVARTLNHIYNQGYILLSFQDVVDEEKILKGLDGIIFSAPEADAHSTALASEPSLSNDWGRPEEDKAWKKL